MLYLIGIGLNDEKDITVKGLEAVKTCDKVYLESYTSRLSCSKEDMESFYGKEVILADRALVEDGSKILKEAKEKNVALLVIGDVFGATTHVEIYIEAKKQEIPIQVIHNASVLNAVGITGLSLYKFGKVTTIPLENKNIKSPYEVYLKNKELGLHTLFLLDIKENQLMTTDEAAEYLGRMGIPRETKCVAVGGLGSNDPDIRYVTLDNAVVNKYPQCLIIPGELHFKEEEALEFFA
ncbi:MAG: diphthine synthase [Candidatus Nanoarchaeia archaeon]|nr:diphthine synthase [Candidatus Nanoarchaeia archaeon]